MSPRKLLTIVSAVLAVMLALATAPVGGRAQSVQSADSAHNPVVSAAPRSYVVVSVPVPAEFARSVAVDYQIEAAQSISLVGRPSGSLRERGQSDRSVLLTLGIPAHARAGRMTGAWVSFSAAGIATVQVPVAINITAVHKIALATRDLASVHVGTRITLPCTVRNEGNTPDTVMVRVTLPPGWHAPDAQRELQVALEPGATAEKSLRISVPRGSATGNFFIHIEATTGAQRATSMAVVEVVGGPAGALVGPSVQASLAAVVGGGAEMASVFAATLNGLITSSVRVDGRFALASSDEPIAMRGFSRVDVFATTPYVSISAPDWRVSAGNTAVGYGELTGTNAWGNALSGSFSYGSHSISGIAAPPADFNEGTELYGGTYSARTRQLTVTSTAMRLREDHYSSRELSAAGFGVALDRLPLGTALSGEVAYRDYSLGTGVGYAGEVRNEQSRGRVQLRYLHAPGGSAAFARARDELSASASRRLLPRWDISGSYFSASDSNSTLASMRSRALAFNQRYQLNPEIILNLDAQLSRFSAEAAVADAAFGSNEQLLLSGVTVRRGSLSYGGEVGVESVRRSTELADGLSSVVSGTRGVLRTSAELATTNGVIQAESGYQRSASTLLPSLLTFAARAGQVRVPLPAGDVFLNGEALYQSWGVARSANMIVRGGVTVPLPTRMELSAHAEYNTFFKNATARSPLVFSLKLERSLNLPRLRMSSSSGYVFQDLNNSGTREIDEPGVGNVVVRQGAARAVTGRDGRYDFWERTPGSLTIEASSLPVGLVLSQHPAGAAGDLALVPTATVVVTMAAELENTHNMSSDMARVIVLARDKEGREWVARRAGNTNAFFDGLPPGEYTLEFDFTVLPEAMRTQNTISFRVDGRSTLRLTVPVVGRPVRMFRAPSNSANRDGHKK